MGSRSAGICAQGGARFHSREGGASCGRSSESLMGGGAEILVLIILVLLIFPVIFWCSHNRLFIIFVCLFVCVVV